MVVLYLVSNRMVLSYNRQTTQYNRFSLLNPSSVLFVVFFTLVFAVRYNRELQPLLRPSHLPHIL